MATSTQDPTTLNSDNNTTKSVDINIKEKAQSDSTTLNFVDGGWLQDHVAKPTAVPLPTRYETVHSGTGQTVDQVRAQMLEDEKKEESKMTVEDFEDVADFIIDAVDMLAVFLLRWYAMDNTDAPYQVPVDKLKKLKHRLSRLLMRMQAKFPLGFLFIIGLLLTYASAAKKAKDHRKEEMERRKKIAAAKAATAPPIQRPAPVKNTQVVAKEETATIIPLKPAPPKISQDLIERARQVQEYAEAEVITEPKRPRGRPSK